MRVERAKGATTRLMVLPWVVSGAALALALTASVGFAQQPPAGVGTLDDIVVKGQLLRARNAPYSATTLSGDELRDLNVGSTDGLFEQVPGMAVRDFGLGGVANAIVIRGFGNGGHGGDLGAILDGVPLNEAMSHADGYVDLNVVVPLEIESFTVYKGPVSPLYGNFNRGGLVAIETRKSGDYAQLDVGGGSFSTVDVQGAYGAALGERHRVNAAAQLYRTDGFRPQSTARRGTVSGRWAIDATPSLQVAISGRWHNADADSASYLLRQQWLVDPAGIDPRVQNDGATKDFLTLRADVNWQVAPDAKLLTYAYTTQQDFTRWFSRPVSPATWRQREESYDRAVYGLGTSLNGRLQVAGTPWSYVAGLETIRESTAYVFYDALDHRRRVSPALNDRETALNDLAAFAEVEAPLHPRARVTLGVRADRFTGGCERRGPETGSDPCGPLNDPRHVSPKFGMRSDVLPGLQLRASWAEGFALPNGFVKYAAGGQPLDENVFRQTELGLHWLAADLLDFDLAAYRLTSSGEVRTVSPGVFENFGATRREGIEAAARFTPVASLQLTAVYGVTTSEVTQGADPRLLGKRVPGVPVNSATVGVDWSPAGAWTLTLGYRFVGGYSIDAPNTQQAASYALWDAALAFRGGARWPYRAYLRIDNVTDESHATNELLLAGQRAVAPGAPRAVRVGIQVDLR